MRVNRWFGGAAAAAVMATIAVSPGVAHAGMEDGNPDDDSYSAGVSVRLSGHVSTSRRASVKAPRPLCWWRTPGISSDPKDAKVFAEAATATLQGIRNPDTAEHYTMQFAGGFTALDDAVAQEAAGNDVSWWALDHSLEGSAEEVVKQLVEAGCTTSQMGGYGPVAAIYRWFPGSTPPPPTVDAYSLALYAYEVLDLVPPALEWNPKIEERSNSALVNLPTWMWVSQDASVQVREITAAIGPVSVTVRARPAGMTVTSDPGTVDCTNEQARREYLLSRDESSACTMTFIRGSYGKPKGFPVTAETSWTATWDSTTGEGGELGPKQVTETTYVPVAQSEALVTDVD